VYVCVCVCVLRGCWARSIVWRQTKRPPSLALGPLQWWFRVFQLSTAGGSVPAEMELSASSLLWRCGSAGLSGLCLNREHNQSQPLRCLNWDYLWIKEIAYMAPPEPRQAFLSEDTCVVMVHVPRSAFMSCSLPMTMTCRAKMLYIASQYAGGCLPIWTWSSIIIILLMGRGFGIFFELHIIFFRLWFPIHRSGV